MRPGMNRQSTAPLKKGEFKKNIGKLVVFMRPYYIPVLVSLVFTIGATILSIFAPQILADLVNVITASFGGGLIDMTELEKFALILVVFYACNALCTYVSSFIMTTVSQKMSRALRTQISEKINRVPLRYFDSHPYGDTLSRVTNDVDTIGNSMQQSVSMVVQSVCMFVGVLIAMFVSCWQLALTVLIIVPFMAVLLFVIMKFSQPQFRKQQDELAVLNGKVEENYSGQLVIKAFNAEKRTGEDFEATNKRLRKSTFLSQALSGIMQPAMSFISYFAYAAVCVVAGLMIATPGSGVDYGMLSAFLVYVNLFQSPLSQIAQAANVLQSAAAASGRVFEFLEEEELSDESGKTAYLPADKVRGDVVFEHVRFGYDPGRVIIHDFSAEAKAGQKVAIVGPTGAGKTTMVNLLMRFYEVNGGCIKIDGIPTGELTRENVHDLFCMVLQDTWLFDGTIRENVVYSKQNVTDEEVVRACKAVGLHHFIMTLPKGYDTVLDDKANLSAGQKQLVTIARAMIENAPMLILDEATSSVDTRTEVLIQQAMDRLTVGRTSFIIAHRLSTIKNADLILVMKDGDIIEKGNHEQLLARNGFYAELYNSQFEQA